MTPHLADASPETQDCLHPDHNPWTDDGYMAVCLCGCCLETDTCANWVMSE